MGFSCAKEHLIFRLQHALEKNLPFGTLANFRRSLVSFCYEYSSLVTWAYFVYAVNVYGNEYVNSDGPNNVLRHIDSHDVESSQLYYITYVF